MKYSELGKMKITFGVPDLRWPSKSSEKYQTKNFDFPSVGFRRRNDGRRSLYIREITVDILKVCDGT